MWKGGLNFSPCNFSVTVCSQSRRASRVIDQCSLQVREMGFTGELSKEELDSFHSEGNQETPIPLPNRKFSSKNCGDFDVALSKFAGFLVLSSFASVEEVQSMTAKMEDLLEKFDCTLSRSVFSTTNQVHLYIFLAFFLYWRILVSLSTEKHYGRVLLRKRRKDLLFLRRCARKTLNSRYNSGLKCWTIAEKAYGEDGLLKQPKHLSINKVGHGWWFTYTIEFDLFWLWLSCILSALHEIDPVFKKFCSSEKIARLFFSMGYQRPAIIQSMYIFKVL